MSSQSVPDPAPKSAPQTGKLGILIPQFPGQTHIFFWREIIELEKSGTSVALLSTRPPPPGLISHDWSDAAIARTVYLGDTAPLNALAALPRLPLRSLWRDLRRAPRAFLRDVVIALPAARRLMQQARAQGITHVHAHSCGRAALIAALANRIWGLPYSLTLHGPLSDYGPGQGFKWRHAAFGTVITRKLTAELRAELGRDLPPDLYLQPMGVDTEALRRPAPYAPPRPGEPLRLFACGRLNQVKGHQDLLAALRLLRDRGIDATLEIAGQDDDGGSGYRLYLEQRIRDLNLEPHARLLGAIDADAVRDHLCNAHVFILASWHEPLGVAYMEAMSCGTPTIGTDAGGVPELITPGETGVLVPPKNPKALAETIARLAADPDHLLALSRAGRDHIVAGYSSARGAQTLTDAISKATTS